MRLKTLLSFTVVVVTAITIIAVFIANRINSPQNGVAQQFFFVDDPFFDIDTSSSERKWNPRFYAPSTFADEWTGDGATTTFWTSRTPLTTDTETVYVDNTLMIKDDNYTITYSTGNITFHFTPAVVPINATYRYTRDGSVNIIDGIAVFKVNESSGTAWGVPTLYQGKRYHSMGEWGKILNGTQYSTATPVNGVTFHKDYPIKSNTYFLNVRMMIVNRTYITGSTIPGTTRARGNIGVEIMASYTQRMPDGTTTNPDYDDPDEKLRTAVRIVVLVSKFYWDEDLSEWYDYEGGEGFSIPQGDWAKDTGISNDYEVTLVEGKMNTTDTWYTFKIDLAPVFSTVFEILNSETNVAGLTSCPNYIETLTVHGVQFITEMVGLSIETKVDYVWFHIGA